MSEQFQTDADGYLSVSDATEHYYKRLTDYYDLQMQSIGPDEYAFLKETLGYPETYDEHMKSLQDSLKSEETTKGNIGVFLEKYCEFRHCQYIMVWDYINDMLVKNPEHVKQIAKQSLLQLHQNDGNGNNGNDDDGDDDGNGDDDKSPVSSTNIPDHIPFQLPNGTEIELPSYGDPLIVCMYSVCFIALNFRFDYNRQDTTKTTELL